jgi:membrane protease YdiL (CAAX protease family)
MQRNEPKANFLDYLLRVGGFAVVAVAVWLFAGGLMADLGTLTRSAFAVFVAGLTANLVLTRKFEHGRPADFGLGWELRSFRHFASGLALGGGAVAVLVLGTVASGAAKFEPVRVDSSTPLLAILLLAGVFGEELMFRGYAFQYLVREWSPLATILCSGALFGLVHLANENVQVLGAINTALWGCLLGYAYVRTRALWLPAGLHFGWNLALVLFTSNMSGITIRATAWNLRWSASDLWSGGGYGLEGGLLATFAAVPVFLFLRRLR